MKNLLKKTKGITLIALVVTIVVLLILAGITVTSLTGDKAIIKEARSAAESAEYKALEEQVEAAIIVAEQKYGNNTTLDRVITEIMKIDHVTDVNRETGAVTSELGYVVEGKLNDYLNNGETGGDETPKPSVADKLVVNPNAEDAPVKSPYVKYNGMDCRVLYNDDTRGVQIITSASVCNVKLGYLDTEVEAADFTYSGKATNVNDNFKKSALSYNNAVDNLNRKAKTYMDTEGMAIDARCLGSVPTLTSDGKFQEDSSGMFNSGYSWVKNYGWSGRFKDYDTNYQEDVEQFESLGLTEGWKDGYCWLASRGILNGNTNTSNAGYTSFRIRRYSPTGLETWAEMCKLNYSRNGSFFLWAT